MSFSSPSWFSRLAFPASLALGALLPNLAQAGWTASAWFGYLWAEPATTPWTWHHELGWIWLPEPFAEESAGLYYYDPEAGWVYTGRDWFPIEYHFARHWWVSWEGASEGRQHYTNLARQTPFALPVWRAFSAESPWNTPIPAGADLDPANAALVETLAQGTDRGLYINLPSWSISVYYVDSATTPRVNVLNSRAGVVGTGFQNPNTVPMPADPVASPPHPNGDQHLCLIDPVAMLEWGMWKTVKNSQGVWSTGLGAVTDLTGTGVRPPVDVTPNPSGNYVSHSARASGFPLIAGLLRVEEVRAGRIDHALVFAYNHCRSGAFLPPASTSQANNGKINQTSGIPMGGRIQLDPAWDVENSDLTDSGKILARALQEYGAYCGDYAGAFVLYAENSPEAVAAWNGLLSPEELRPFFTPAFIRQHFRVIDMGTLRRGQNWEN